MGYIGLIVLLAFLMSKILIGGLLSRWVDTGDDFMVAGRHLTPFILASALTAANVNLFSFIGQSGTAYMHGISIIWQSWTGNMGLVFAGLLIIPILRRLKIKTVPEFLEMRYSRVIRILIGFLWVLRLTFWLGVVLVAATVAFSTIAYVPGLEITSSQTFWLFLFAGIAIVFTFMGGMWAVTIIDSIQFILMLGGALIILPIVMAKVGWWPGLMSHLAEGRMNLVPQTGQYNWEFILAIWILGIQWASTDAGLLQMSLSSKDPRSAARGLVLAGIITTPFALLWILPGLVSSVLLPGLTNMDKAFPTLISTSLGPALIVLVACGLLSNQMSTVSTNLTGAASVFCNDVYKSLFQREASPRQTLIIVRTMIVIAGLMGIGFAFLIPMIGENVVDAYLTVVGIFDMPFFVITIVFGLLWKRGNWQGMLIGYLVGIAVGSLSAYYRGVDAFFFSTFLSTASVLVVAPLASLLFPAPPKEKIEKVWRARTHDVEDDGAVFHLIPVSGGGRFFMAVFFLGLAMFLAGVFSGSVGYVHAGMLALCGMIVYFGAGLLRLMFD